MLRGFDLMGRGNLSLPSFFFAVLFAGAPLAGELSRPDAHRKTRLIPPAEVVWNGHASRFRSLPGESLSCGSPCTTGALSASHPFFELLLDCDDGTYAAKTGSSHPFFPDASILYDAAASQTGSDVALHLYNDGSDHDLVGGSACLFDPADTANEQASIGLENERSFSPLAGLDLILRHELVAFGATAADAGVRLTLEVTNQASSTVDAELGLRWYLDLQNGPDDGPWRAPVTCTPFTVGVEEFTEHEIAAAEIQDFIRFRNNDGPDELQIFTSTSAVSGFPASAMPDRLVYGWWANMFGAVWDYIPFELDSADDDAVLLFYSGETQANAIVLAPGTSIRRSVVFLMVCDQQSGCALPTGAVGNALRAVEAMSDVELSWADSTLVPGDVRVFRTADKTQVVETAAGIGDETVVVDTSATSATDAGAVAVATDYFYQVLPVDTCSDTVYP